MQIFTRTILEIEICMHVNPEISERVPGIQRDDTTAAAKQATGPTILHCPAP